MTVTLYSWEPVAGTLATHSSPAAPCVATLATPPPTSDHCWVCRDHGPPPPTAPPCPNPKGWGIR